VLRASEPLFQRTEEHKKQIQHTLGSAIRKRRQELELTQEGVAARAALHVSYVAQLERGERNPSLLIICALATALECEPWELLRPPDDERA